MSDNITLPREVVQKTLNTLKSSARAGAQWSRLYHASKNVGDAIYALETALAAEPAVNESEVETARLRREIKRLREALKRHGMHGADCVPHGECKCGLDAALRREEKA